MKISIITPSFNQAEYLEKTILSVWAQQGNYDLEYIVADGGSTDGSYEILQKYDRLFKSGELNHSCRSFSFKWWSCKDNGQSNAINQGFASSAGEIVGWLNSDDTYIDSESLSRMLRPFQERVCDIVIGNGYHIDSKDNKLDIPCLINELDNSKFQYRLKTLSRYNFILQPATLFRRSVWESCSIDEKLHYVMDWVFWIEARRKGFRFCKIDSFVATNRIHDDAKTVDGGIEKYAEGLIVFRRYKIWCLNRFFYYMYLLLLTSSNNLLVVNYFNKILVFAKKTRRTLINRFKIY